VDQGRQDQKEIVGVTASTDDLVLRMIAVRKSNRDIIYPTLF
jgi:hypothetical protein